MKLLDCGCNDGWMLANLHAMEGVEFDRLDGIELNAGACVRARQRQHEHGWHGEIVCDDIHNAPEHFPAGTYDAVACFEVLEHVPDPRRLISVLARMVKPGGRVYISTPDGAFERGDVPGWAKVEPKGHLRAIPPPDLASYLCEQGVIDAFEVPPDRVQVAAFRPEPRKGKVIFYAGPVEALPETIISDGLGGSETALCKMAEHFARRGYDVRVYAGEGGGLRGDRVSVDDMRDRTQGQVLYEPVGAWDPGEECDLFVSSRIPEAFDRTIAAPRRALWLHDHEYGDRLTAERAGRATDVIVLSEFQREHIAERYPFLADHPGLWVSRNGIEASFYQRVAKRKEPWVVYSSSPDRGLDVLLEMWPEIKARVPEAKLVHTYAPFYHQVRERFDHLQRFHRRIERLHEGLEGVERRESMGQKELAVLFGAARVWAHPSWVTQAGEPWPEISCISAIEAQAAGCVPVCPDYAALKETVRDGAWTPFPVQGGLDDTWRKAFVREVVDALNGERKLAPDARKWALDQDWGNVCDDWERRFLAPRIPGQGAPALVEPGERVAA